jgi:hypothetical protein
VAYLEEEAAVEVLTRQISILGEMMVQQAASMDEMKRQMAKRSKSPTTSESSFQKIESEH